MDCEPNILIFTNDLHWKLILSSRIHVFIQQLYFELCYMTFSVLVEGDTAVTNTKFLSFGDFSGENRQKKKIKIPKQNKTRNSLPSLL